MGERIESEEHYFYEMFDVLSEDVISDEQYNRNKLLIDEISNLFYDLNSRQNKLSPETGRKVLEIIFSSIEKYGFR